MTLRRALTRLLVAAALVAGVERVGSADKRPRLVLSWDDKQVLHMSVSYREIVDPGVLQKLQSGLPTTIVMSAAVFHDGVIKPFAGSAKRCVVVFDLWDEVYHLQINGSSDDVIVASVDGSVDGVLRRCAEVDIVSPRWALTSGPYFILAKASVNPVSSDMIERIKSWVSRPVGTNVAAGDALFGSFVDLFVTRSIGDADRVLEFRQTFTL